MIRISCFIIRWGSGTRIGVGGDDRLARLIHAAAHCDVDILIEGETGTGKERLARLIHNLSKRRAKDLVSISCAAITPTLIESELFGHLKGSFTGAISTKTGVFEAAQGSTVFLDELNNLRKHHQAVLLRFLQEREIKPVASKELKKLDVRVLCAINQSARQMLKEKQLRDDLYYRIGAFSISIPPLRNRKEIIPKLAQYFIEKYRNNPKKEIILTAGAMRLLEIHPWPGNIREFENLIRVIVNTTNDESITTSHLKPFFKSDHVPTNLLTQATSERWTEDKLISEYRKIIISECGNNKSEAARILGLNRTTLLKGRKRKSMRNALEDFGD
jgi:transcriptional regulator with PAS, ATPase and Fis domain